MTDIQENIDKILVLFERATDVEGCSYVDVEGLRELMKEEVALLTDDYDGTLLGGVVNPFFKTLDTAAIVCSYVRHYTNNVIVYSSLMEQEHIIIATEMMDLVYTIEIEIKKLNVKLKK
jgi:hypothetical protein